MLRAGVSTACLYPRLLEDALYDLALYGVSHVEVFINSHSELRRGFIDTLATLMERFGMTCASLHPYTSELETMLLFSEYPRRTADFFDYCRLYFTAMQRLGAKIFVLHGSRVPTNLVNRPQYYERYQMLASLGREYGVIVAQENVSRCASASLEFLEDMKRNLGGEARFVLDIKQAVRARADPMKMLESLGESVVHVHMSDYGSYGDCLLLGRGRLPLSTFLEKLMRVSPNASVILELYRQGFGSTADLVENYHLLESKIRAVMSSMSAQRPEVRG